MRAAYHAAPGRTHFGLLTGRHLTHNAGEFWQKTGLNGCSKDRKWRRSGTSQGGIAHDFNNLLTAILGGLHLYLRRSDATGRDHRYLEGALEAAERGAKLTSRLLAFSRTQQFGIKAVDVRATLDGMSELLRQSLGPTIDIRVVVNPSAEWVSTDAGQLEFALLNLAVNARDAMPNGGTVTFEAK